MRVRGWCPGLHDPMQSGDGWLARVRPPFGRLSVDQAVALDGLASSCGNGIIEITSRGNLQVRGLHAHARLVDGVCAAGLGQRDPVLERRRRAMAAPFADEQLVDWVEQALMGCAAVDALPAKFVVRVDGGAVPIADVPADVGVSRERDEIRVVNGGRAGRAAPGPIGRLREIDAVAVAPRFGQFESGDLAALARRAGAELRITPFRSVIVAGAAEDFAAGLGMITDGADPRRRVVACVGAPRCSSGVGPARDVAERYLSLLPSVGLLHVSGCEKRCAFGGDAILVIPGSGTERRSA